MRTAFITGIGGQDGSYLAELLLREGYRVVGTVNGSVRSRHPKIEHLRESITLADVSLVDRLALERALELYAPEEFYNLAAFHPASSQSQIDPVLISEMNGVAVVKILEAIRAVGTMTKLCQASTALMYGSPTTSPQDEETPFHPTNPYAIAKAFAHCNVAYYRDVHGVHASSCILFNHESPRRSEKFVTRKISMAVARIKACLQQELELDNLDARRDWGYAPDYVHAMWQMLQRNCGDDYVIATGKTHSVRDFCRIAFEHVGLDYERYVLQSVARYVPAEAVALTGNSRKAHETLGWRRTLEFEELVCDMVDADMALIMNQS